MKKILVTGASGFIGRHVLPPLLTRNFEIHAVSRHHHPEPTDKIIWHQADLLDPAAATALVTQLHPTHLLHAAWYAEPGLFWNARENQAWLTASKAILEAFAAAGGQRLLTVGSCAEYDWNREDNTPWLETDACQPHTLYGQTKLALFQAAAKLAEDHHLSVAHARLFFLFGPGEPEKKLIASLCSEVSRNQSVACGSGDIVRDYLDVRDAGNALATLLDSGLEGVVNVGSGQPLSLSEIATIIETLSGRSGLIQLGARPRSPQEPRHIVANCEKLRQLEMLPLPDVKTRLAETIQAHLKTMTP